MSWPSVIVLVFVERRPSLEGRIRSLELVPDPVTGDERLHQHGYSYRIDLSGGILADYEPEELEQVRTRIGEPYAVYVSCQSMDAARVFLRDVLPGADGLVDTNHHEILQASELLTLVDRYPGRDWGARPGPFPAKGRGRRSCRVAQGPGRRELAVPEWPIRTRSRPVDLDRPAVTAAALVIWLRS